MLGDLKALHHIEAATEVDRLAQIRATKLICIYHQVLLVEERAVDTHYFCAGLPPHAQPTAVAASEIDDAVDRQQGVQQRYDLFRRTDRKGSQKAVEIVAVFVQLG